MIKVMTPVEVWKCLEKDLWSSCLVDKLLEGCTCLRWEVLVLIFNTADRGPGMRTSEGQHMLDLLKVKIRGGQ